MSVRAWKRAITIGVIAIIVILLVSTIVLGSQYNSISDKYSQLADDSERLNKEYVVDLSQYDNINMDKYENILDFLKNSSTNNTFTYQNDYEELYVDNDFNFCPSEDRKVCYLTFDDGPDPENTAKILDTLKKYNAKATFFVMYSDKKANTEIYKRIVDEGHTIAVHSTSHDYTLIYSSVEAFLKDFSKCAEKIEEVTGVKPNIFRFAGGSVNSYNTGIYRELISEMIRRGYVYYDWNASGGDAVASYVSAGDIVKNVLDKSRKLNKKIVLLHDGRGHKSTAEALPDIVEGLQEQGYSLEKLDCTVEPVFFGY